MNPKLKTAFRTLQTNFPFLLEAKFGLMRRYRNGMGIPFDKDFNAISLFPDVDGAVYLDIGANRGQSTDAILMKKKKCVVHLFEPNPLLCEKLGSLFQGNPRTILHEFGLGEQPAGQSLYVPFYKRWMFDGLASFDEEKAKSWLRGRMFYYKEAHLTVREVKCNVRRLDELDLKPFFMKLDIQGYEAAAIRGAEQTIKAHEPVLLVESASRDEIIGFLQQFDYQFYAFKGNKFVPGILGSRNTFFMTPAKAALVKSHIEPVRAQSPAQWQEATAPARV